MAKSVAIQRLASLAGRAITFGAAGASNPPPPSTYRQQNASHQQIDRSFHSLGSQYPERYATVSVEGNIASGKTGALQYIASKTDLVEPIEEPVHQWRNVEGLNLLGLMYKDPERCTMAFQSYVQLTMYMHHTRATCKPIKIMERSLHSARFCFIKHMRNTKSMADYDFVVLNQWYELLKQYAPIDLIVYLRSDPDVVYDRLLKRHRNEELAVTIEYLTALHNLHEEWLFEDGGVPVDLGRPKILTIDASQGLEVVRRQLDEMVLPALRSLVHPVAAAHLRDFPSQETSSLCG